MSPKSAIFWKFTWGLINQVPHSSGICWLKSVCFTWFGFYRKRTMTKCWRMFPSVALSYLITSMNGITTDLSVIWRQAKLRSKPTSNVQGSPHPTFLFLQTQSRYWCVHTLDLSKHSTSIHSWDTHLLRTNLPGFALLLAVQLLLLPRQPWRRRVRVSVRQPAVRHVRPVVFTLRKRHGIVKTADARILQWHAFFLCFWISFPQPDWQILNQKNSFSLLSESRKGFFLLSGHITILVNWPIMACNLVSFLFETWFGVEWTWQLLQFSPRCFPSVGLQNIHFLSSKQHQK